MNGVRAVRPVAAPGLRPVSRRKRYRISFPDAPVPFAPLRNVSGYFQDPPKTMKSGHKKTAPLLARYVFESW
jgi:hypothetical protein